MEERDEGGANMSTRAMAWEKSRKRQRRAGACRVEWATIASLCGGRSPTKVVGKVANVVV